MFPVKRFYSSISFFYGIASRWPRMSVSSFCIFKTWNLTRSSKLTAEYIPKEKKTSQWHDNFNIVFHPVKFYLIAKGNIWMPCESHFFALWPLVGVIIYCSLFIGFSFSILYLNVTFLNALKCLNCPQVPSLSVSNIVVSCWWKGWDLFIISVVGLVSYHLFHLDELNEIRLFITTWKLA